MSNKIINQNADEQEVAQAPAAITKSPVDDNMEEQKNDLKSSVNAVAQKEETKQPGTEPRESTEGVATDSREVQKPVESARHSEAEIPDAVPASPHDDFDWTVDKRNVT